MSRAHRFATFGLLAALQLLATNPAQAGGLSFVDYEREDTPGTNGLGRAGAVAVSADGENVYVVGQKAHALSVWDRDTTTGAISFVEFEEDGVGGVDGIRSPSSVAVGPDGACVYATGEMDDAVAAFSRNVLTGALTFVEFESDGTGGVNGIRNASAVAVSPDSLHVYVTGEQDDAVAVFENTGGCALTFVEFKEDGSGGVSGMLRPRAITISPDGLSVYVAATRMGETGAILATVAVFDRNVLTGALSFVEFEQEEVAGVERLINAVALSVSPDGANLYAASRGGDAVVAFTRNVLDGTLTFLETERRAGVVKGLKGASGVAVSPDGAYVYVTGRAEDAVVVFRRDPPAGKLRFLEFHDDPAPFEKVLTAAEGVAVSPDGASVYVTGSAVDTLVAFAVDTCGNGTVGIDEQCDDDNVAGGDGCSAACRFELCGPLPAGGCRVTTEPEQAAFTIKNDPAGDDAKDQVQWKWKKGEATTFAEFGNPATTASYVLCVYDSSVLPQPLVSLAAPAGGTCDGKPCWKPSTTSHKYNDKFLTPDGLQVVQLKAGISTKASVQVKGKKGNLLPPGLPLTLPVTVQLRNTQNSVCWEATYSTASQTSAEFKAKGD